MKNLNIWALVLGGVLFFSAGFGAPTPAYASGLTNPQIQAIISLLSAFNADASVISNVSTALHAQQAPSSVAIANSTWTTPSGAVIDSSGNVVTPPQTTLQQQVANSSCNTQISQLQQQILQLKKKLQGVIAGDLSSGTSAVGQGNAFQDTLREAQQEAPLQAQLQQLNLSCQPTSYVAPTLSQSPTTQSTPLAYGPDITTNMETSILSLAKSLVTSTACPGTPVIVVRPENGTLNAIYHVVASVTNNSITWSVSPAPVDGYMTYLDMVFYDPCVPVNQIVWSYTSPIMGTVGSNTLQIPADGMAEGGILATSTAPQTITITATEPGGGTVTKTLTVRMAQQ